MTVPPTKPTPAPMPMRGPRVVVRKADTSVADKAKERKKTIYALWGMGLLAAGVLVWAGWSFVGDWFKTTPPDPEKMAAKDLVAYLASDKFNALPDDMKDAYSQRLQRLPDDRRTDLRDRVEGLSTQDRRKVGGAMSRAWRKQQMEDIRAFFKLSPEDRVAELDKRLSDPNRRGPFGGGPRPDASSRSGDNSTRSGGFGRSGGGGSGGGSADAKGGGPRGPRQPPSADQFQRRMETRLDGTTPEDRAYQTEYYRQLRLRREQLQAQKK